MKLIDIFFHSLFTFIVVILAYWGAELLGIVPYMAFYIFATDGLVTTSKATIFMVILVEVIWVGASVFYWKIIRREKIEL